MLRSSFVPPLARGEHGRTLALRKTVGRRRSPADPDSLRRALGSSPILLILSIPALMPSHGGAAEPEPRAPVVSPFTGAEAPLFGETLREDAFVREVLTRNPGLRAMRAAWEAAAGRPPQETALDDPELSWTFAPATIGDRDLDFAGNVELSQRIPWPGKRSTRGEVATREAEAAAEELEAARLRLAAAAREAYYDWWYAHRALAIHQKNAALLEELRHVAEVRYAAALASKQDALHAEVETRQLEHRGVVLRRMREVALARLNTLLDRAPKDPLPPPPTALAAPAPAAPLGELESEAVDRRPVLRAERRRIDARQAAVRLAELERFPNFMVMGAYDRFWEVEELRPMIGVGIEIPLQLARRQAAIGEARARRQEAEALLAAKRGEVLLEVSRAYDELVEHRHVVELYRTSIVPAATESLAAARSGYETGTNDFLTVIEAEKALLRAELTHERGIAEASKARARLERAAGTPLATEDKR